jgi:hypothetical protein
MGTLLINGKDGIIIRSSIPVPAKIEDIMHNPQYMDRIVNAERDLKINHRIETKNNTHISIAERNGGKEFSPEVCSDVAMSHSKLIQLLSTLYKEDRAKQINLDDNPGEPEHEPTDEELFQCLFDYLKETFGVIIIGIVK